MTRTRCQPSCRCDVAWSYGGQDTPASVNEHKSSVPAGLPTYLLVPPSGACAEALPPLRCFDACRPF